MNQPAGTGRGRGGSEAAREEAPLLSAAQGLALLALPQAHERASAASGVPLLAVDLREAPPLSAEALARARAALSGLPCVTAALAPDGARAAGVAALEGCFDVAIPEPGALAELAAAVRASPLAATVLVQLLRRGESRPLADGLVAESLAYSVLQAGPEHARWKAARGPMPPPPEEPEPAVGVERRGRRLLITLQRASRRNAFSRAMRDGFCQAFAVAEADPRLTHVELRGRGPDFSSGGDLAEFGTLPDPATAHSIRCARSPARAIAACASRVHAHVHGACVGAGMELPAFGRRVSASEDAWFRLPELSMGLIPGAGGTVSLPRRIGRQRTAWLALTGQPIDAAAALAMGLVDEIEPA